MGRIGRVVTLVIAAGTTAAAGLALSATASANIDVVGQPLPAVSGVWDALAADFDAQNGRDIVITAHDARDGHWGGIYFGDGSGGWALGFPFPDADRHGCDAGDVNGDRRLDLFCEVGADRGTGSGLNDLFIQQPGGGFVDEAAAWGVQDPLGRGRRPMLFDANGDGLTDLYLTNAKRPDGLSPGNRLYLNTGQGSFTEQVGALTGNLGYRCVIHGDINGDGRQDVIVCPADAPLRVFENTGSGFADAGSVTGAPVAAVRDAELGDLNGDGLVDLILVLADRVEVRLNQGPGDFSQVDRSVGLTDGQRAQIGDMNADGGPDVYVTDGCDAFGADSPDPLLLAPGFDPVTAPGDPTGGCGNEVIDAGKLVVFNGDDLNVGPVTVRALPLIPPPAVEPPPPPPPPPPTAPETKITKLKARHRAVTVRFEAKGGERPVGFECRIDARRFAPCSSPARYRRLALGRHRARVRAVDAIGEADPTPAMRKFRLRRRGHRGG